MGSSKATTVGYWYKVLYHHGLGIGPIDAFLEFRGGDKTAWQGELTQSGAIHVNAPNLWGGEKDQGGIVGDLDVMFGEATQQPNPYLLANLGAQVPAWRGLATVVFKGGKYGAMNPYPHSAAYKIRKILKGWDGECWYPEKAAAGESIQREAVVHPASWRDRGTDCFNIGAAQETSGVFNRPNDQSWYKGYIDSVRVTKGVARYTTPTFSPPAGFLEGAADPHWGSVVSLVKFYGTHGSSAPFTDQTGNQVTLLGGAHLSTVQQLFGPSSCHFDGIDDWVKVVVGTSQQDLGDTYTVEGWIYLTGRVTNAHGAVLLSAGPVPSVSGYDTGFGVIGDYPNFYQYDVVPDPMGVDITGTLEVVPLSAWTHISLSRDGRTNMYYVHVNGKLATGVARQFAMNPAHILYYARTHSDIGREPADNINDASYRAAADKLFAEGFGICTEYDPATESLEEFEARICRLIGGSVNRSLVDGQYYLDLARGDYVLEDLPILTDDDILDFSEQPSTLDGAVNSVSVEYFDPERKEEVTTAPVQALALIDAFGTIHQTHRYPEIPTAELALRVAERDLRTTVTPTRAFELVTTRKTYAWRPNQYFRLQAPKRGIADMVCIVGDKQSGTLRSGAIRMTATQDIYSLPTAVFVEVEPGVDTRPPQTPAPITLQRAFEAPYIEVVQALSRADLAVLPPEVGYLLTVAADPAVSRDYAVVVSDGGPYAEVATGLWCPTATVVEAAGYLDTTFTLSGGTHLDQIAVGSAALWDDEIVRVDAIDAGTGVITLGRGCGDTVPQPHAAGSRIWFYDAAAAVSTEEYTDGETVNVKLLTNTGSQQLSEAVATPMSVSFGQRHARPYPPGRLRITDSVAAEQAYPAICYAELTIAWAHRDRVVQADQKLDANAGSIGPEAGTTYTVRVYLDEVLVQTQSGIIGTTSAPFALPGNGLARVEVEAVRDGLISWQAATAEFEWRATPPAVRITDAGDTRITDAGDRRVKES